MSGYSRLLLAGLLTACACVAAPAAVVDDDSLSAPDVSFPPADELLRTVLSTFPSVPVRVESQIIAKDRSGDIQKRLNAVMELDWGASEPSARYAIEDAFGSPLEELEIRWRADGERRVRYRKGDPLEDAALANLYERVQDTDISWIDLALAYLWWPDGKTVGAERVRGRFCYVVDLPAPAGESGAYDGVRLWIDPQIGILLQAAAYDVDGQLVKLLEVKSFKKIRDVWIIQNIDVQSFPARHKTSLKVKKAEAD